MIGYDEKKTTTISLKRAQIYKNKINYTYLKQSKDSENIYISSNKGIIISINILINI